MQGVRARGDPGADGNQEALLLREVPEVNPVMRIVWLFFMAKKKLGLTRLGRPARPPALTPTNSPPYDDALTPHRYHAVTRLELQRVGECSNNM